jgi:hypothetical protein
VIPRGRPHWLRDTWQSMEHHLCTLALRTVWSRLSLMRHSPLLSLDEFWFGVMSLSSAAPAQQFATHKIARVIAISPKGSLLRG